jgi:hypothetical protein
MWKFSKQCFGLPAKCSNCKILTEVRFLFLLTTKITFTKIRIFINHTIPKQLCQFSHCTFTFLWLCFSDKFQKKKKKEQLLSPQSQFSQVSFAIYHLLSPPCFPERVLIIQFLTIGNKDWFQPLCYLYVRKADTF